MVAKQDFPNKREKEGKRGKESDNERISECENGVHGK